VTSLALESAYKSALIPLSGRLIKAAMGRDSLQWLSRLEIYAELDSTNRYLLVQARKDVSRGRVCLAEAQSAGRGRHGRLWISPPSGNIYLSLLWYFSVPSQFLGGLSLVVGVAVCRALEEQKIGGIGLKWPNDLLWEQRKLGGILVELVPKERGTGVVIGVGINVAMPPFYKEQVDQPCVDLLEVMPAQPLRRNQLVGRLIHHLLLIMGDFESQGLDCCLHDWRRWDACYLREVYLYRGDAVVIGTACGVDEKGCLLLREREGISSYSSGEVRLRLAP
jgi:BirA family transcriptional regulator, biotin operon repressor / biotin---[acetyl-CoA-carboxylase] ligase